MKSDVLRRFVWLWVCLIGWAVPAGAATIFSFNGVGDPVRRIDVRARGMGGAGRALLNGQGFSLANPALLAGLRRPVFNTLFFVQRRALEDIGGQKHVVSDGDLGAFQVGVPIRRGTAFGIGLGPITDLDFSLAESIDSGSLPYTLNIEGTGGIQAVTLGVGQRAGRKVYLGARLDLVVLGTIVETWTKTFGDINVLDSEDRIVRTHRGVVPAFGAVYAPTEKWSLGVAFQAEGTIRQTLRIRNLFAEREFEEELQSRTDIKLPFSAGGGIAYSAGYRWMAALDIERAYWGRTGSGRYNTLELAGGMLYRTGQEDPLALSRRIELMMGMHYRSLYFQTDSGSQISEVGGSLGFTIPFQSGRGAFRYVIEFGRRGDTARNGISERFILQTFSISGLLK